MTGTDRWHGRLCGARPWRAMLLGWVGLGLGMSGCGGAPTGAPVAPETEPSRSGAAGARATADPQAGSAPGGHGATEPTAPHTDAGEPKRPPSPAASAKPHRPARIAEESALRQQFGSRKPVGTVRGKATYYHDSLAGNRTANGERYVPEGFTAAHRSLPFGTVLRVKRASGGPDVYVRVTDRGPFGRRRIILDLSRAAADRIGLVRAGVAEVVIEVMCRERTQVKKGKPRCQLEPPAREP